MGFCLRFEVERSMSRIMSSISLLNFVPFFFFERLRPDLGPSFAFFFGSSLRSISSKYSEKEDCESSIFVTFWPLVSCLGVHSSFGGVHSSLTSIFGETHSSF
jgi:hypothetical protein